MLRPGYLNAIFKRANNCLRNFLWFYLSRLHNVRSVQAEVFEVVNK